MLDLLIEKFKVAIWQSETTGSLFMLHLKKFKNKKISAVFVWNNHKTPSCSFGTPENHTESRYLQTEKTWDRREAFQKENRRTPRTHQKLIEKFNKRATQKQQKTSFDSECSGPKRIHSKTQGEKPQLRVRKPTDIFKLKKNICIISDTLRYI